MSTFSCTIWDVGLGSAAFVQCPNGKTILLDCGKSDNLSPAAILKQDHYLGPQGQLDLLVISHPHEDHIADLPAVREQLRPRILGRNRDHSRALIYRDGRNPQREPFKSFKELDEGYCFPVSKADETEPVENWGGVLCKGWSCSEQEAGVEDLNNLSQLSYLRYGILEIIFPGDLEPAGWRALFAHRPNIREYLGKQLQRILIAPHHGRRSGLQDSDKLYTEFLEVIRPNLVIISDEYGNETTDPETYKRYVFGDGVSVNKLDYAAMRPVGMPQPQFKHEQCKVLTTKRHSIIKISEGTILGGPSIYAY